MTLHVRLFAGARELVGQSSVALDLPEGATVATLRERLAAEYPPLAAVLDRAMIAVDTDYAADETPLRPTSEVAVIPPVSGG